MIVASILASLLAISCPAAATPPTTDCGTMHPEYLDYILYVLYPPTCPEPYTMNPTCLAEQNSNYLRNIKAIETTHLITTCGCYTAWETTHDDVALLQCLWNADQTTHDSFESARINYVYQTLVRCCGAID